MRSVGSGRSRRHLVEPAGPEQLRRERLDPVRRRDDEHRRGGPVPAESALLEPGEQAPHDPAADARVEMPRPRPPASSRSRRRGGHTGPSPPRGGGRSVSAPRTGRRGSRGSGPSRAEEREAPAAGDRAREEALAGARDPEQQHALRQIARGEPPRQGLGDAGRSAPCPAIQALSGASPPTPSSVSAGVRRSSSPDFRTSAVFFSLHGRRHRGRSAPGRASGPGRTRSRPRST